MEGKGKRKHFITLFPEQYEKFTKGLKSIKQGGVETRIFNSNYFTKD